MPLEIQPEIAAKQEKDAWESLVKLKVFPESAAVGRQIAELNIPEDTWIAVLRRDGHPMRPGGSTVLQAGDRLTVQSSGQSLEMLRQLVEKKEKEDAPDRLES
ncbi:MAG: potassium/proton antiporter [Euryarchaeota archaeon ADurb.Bin190]|nr:MAG: potassium/proton antiporter [Euryarchaeota archaeon ADurb.Bin190]